MSFFVKSFLILIIVTFTSCQSSKKVFTPDDLIHSDFTFPATITKKQAKEDIEYLEYLLTHVYSGYFYQNKSAVIHAINLLRKIEFNGELSMFHDDVDSALFTIPDNHLDARYRGKFSNAREIYYSNSKGKVGRNSIQDLEKIWEIRNIIKKNKKIALISISRFPNPNNEVWIGFIDRVKKSIEESKILIIDLRGNTGGDDAMGVEMAKLFFQGDFYHPIAKQYRLQNPEVYALWINDEKFKNNNVTQETLLDFKRAKNGEFSSEQIRIGKGGLHERGEFKGIKKPIYILIDRSCGSSCEFVALSLSLHPYVKIVGENSSGSIHFSNAPFAILPHSKFRVRIPTIHSELFDKSFLERIGISPSIYTPQNDDALKVLIKNL